MWIFLTHPELHLEDMQNLKDKLVEHQSNPIREIVSNRWIAYALVIVDLSTNGNIARDTNDYKGYSNEQLKCMGDFTGLNQCFELLFC